MNQYTELNQFDYAIESDEITLINFKSFEPIVNIASEYSINKKIYKVTKMQEQCFKEKLVEEVILPDTIKIIPFQCFSCCKNLKKISLPNKLEVIYAYAFYNNINLKNIIFPNTLKEIRVSAFKNCVQLTNIVCPENLETIETNCFSGCNQLTNIKINNRIQWVDPDCFPKNNKIQLKNIENNKIKIKNNNIFLKQDKNSLIDSYQKEDTLLLEKDEQAFIEIDNNNIKNIITKEKMIRFNFNKKINTIIAPDALNVFCIKLDNNIKNLYITDQCDYINIKSKLKNLYYNGSIQQFNKIRYISLQYQNLIYQKDIDQLLEDGYNFKQINQILKGYQKNILLSNISLNISENILRDIINNFNYDEPILYDLLEKLQQNELNLEDHLQIQNIINNKSKRTKEIQESIEDIK